MSSSEKERKFAFLAEKERRDKWQDYQNRADKQLYEEGKIGFCGTDEDLRNRQREIDTRAVEIREKEQYEKLKRKYG